MLAAGSADDDDGNGAGYDDHSDVYDDDGAQDMSMQHAGSSSQGRKWNEIGGGARRCGNAKCGGCTGEVENAVADHIPPMPLHPFSLFPSFRRLLTNSGVS